MAGDGAAERVPLRAFLDHHCIEWQPVCLDTWVNAEGVTQKKFVANGAKQTDWDVKGTAYKGGVCTKNGLTTGELAARQARNPGAKFVAVNTWAVAQLDVDDPSVLGEPLFKSLLERTPYFLSATKKLPHFFVALPASERIALQRSLDYPEDSAGRLMRTDLIAVPPFWSNGVRPAPTSSDPP
jgi:hypothetical protein